MAAPKARKSKKILKSAAPKEVRSIRNFLCTDDEWAKIKQNAHRWTKGNVSSWLRYAGQTVNPPENDLVAVGDQ